MTEDQRWLLEHRFLPLIDREKPDVILLAGDVYDRSLPPEEAVEVFDWITDEIVGVRRIPMMIISGNHDSAERLSVASRLLRSRGLYIFGPDDRLRPVILSDACGEVAFLPLPYAEPARVRVLLNRLGLEDTEKIKTYEDAERALSGYVLSLLPEEKRNLRKICLAHVFAAGGFASESERPLSIGGYDRISDDVFAPYDYAALGHLHRPQKTQASSEKIRYSGSLMRYSFDEVRQKKGVIIGEMDGEGRISARFEELLPRFQVRVLEGTFEKLMGDETEASEDYLQINLTDQSPVIDAMPRLRKKFPNALGVAQDMGYREDTGERIAELEAMTDEDILSHFVSRFRDHPLTEEEEELARTVWEEVYREEEKK